MHMDLNISRELTNLARMSPRQLRARYAEVFGEPTNANNKTWLIRRIAWRLQSLAEGNLSERARQRAAELANDADLRLNPPRIAATPAAAESTPLVLQCRHDDRLPPPGTLLARTYKCQTVQVKVLPNGFEYDGVVYRSLSAAAKAITGSHCNGYYFFGLADKGGDQ
jgi:hypothetical protein